MKWVVAAIGAFVVLYTVVTLAFRKPGRAFEPHEDLKQRTTFARLQAAGWRRIPVSIYRPAEPAPRIAGPPATVTARNASLPAELAAAFGEASRLPVAIRGLSAPVEATRGDDYSAFFQCDFGGITALLGDVSLYRKGSVLVLIPTTEPLPGRLNARSTEGVYGLSFPTQSLAPGRYTALLMAQGTTARWEFQVK
jgi:hypothetical protein